MVTQRYTEETQRGTEICCHSFCRVLFVVVSVEFSLSLRQFFKATGLLVFILFAFCNASAQDSLVEKPRKWSVNGYVRNMEGVVFNKSKEQWNTTNLFHNRLNCRWFPTSSLTMAMEIRNRFAYGDFFSMMPSYSSSFENEIGIMKLSKNISTGKSYVLNSAIDRLCFEYSKDKLQLTIGRQRINWGQTFVWNPNDIFNAYSYLDFDYEEKPGSDALRLQYYSGPATKTELAISADAQNHVTAAALYKINKWAFDIQGIGGLLASEDYVVGGGWAGQVFKGGFSGELTYLKSISHFNDTSGIILYSLGYDYTFKNSVYLRFEGFYNSNASNSKDINIADYYFRSVTVKNLSLSQYSLFGSIAYPFTPLFNASFALMANPDNNLVFLIPQLSYSLADNIDASLVIQSFYDTSGSEMHAKGTFVFFRTSWSF